MPELRSGKQSQRGRGRGRGGNTPGRGTRASPSAAARGRGANTASRGRGAAGNTRASPAEARQASLGAVVPDRAEAEEAKLAVQPPAAEMRGKEEGETEKDAPPVEEKLKDEDASAAPLPEKVTIPLSTHLNSCVPPPPPPPLPSPRFCRDTSASPVSVPYSVHLLICNYRSIIFYELVSENFTPVCSAKWAVRLCMSSSGSLAMVASGKSM